MCVSVKAAQVGGWLGFEVKIEIELQDLFNWDSDEKYNSRNENEKWNLNHLFQIESHHSTVSG